MLSILAVDHLEGELAFAHEAQLRNKENDRVELAKAQAELEKLKMEDNSAAKMMSRHMKLSQAATNRLQASLISVLSSQLDQSHANTLKQRLALDAAGGDVIREAFGRRREEFAWSLEKRALIGGLDGGRSVLKKGFSADLNDSSESMGQIVVATWVEELRLQTARKLELEKATHSSSSEKFSCTSSFRGNKRRPRGGEASQSTSIVDELTSSESSSSSSTLDPMPFPTKDEPS
ncbi:uncharacterized protein ARMOST_04745 [Armillaria ostoyae]|uniref:Uncharacterized protein n=1 Tax=Armillaria ostoyae TaxID=47428 RepID=A0A284QY66_ARMOS|nr:uncharacterized protein ARMOST_04745 [Armillaria ostoyae]